MLLSKNESHKDSNTNTQKKHVFIPVPRSLALSPSTYHSHTQHACKQVIGTIGTVADLMVLNKSDNMQRLVKLSRAPVEYWVCACTSVLQRVAAYFGVLQRVAVCCSASVED